MKIKRTAPRKASKPIVPNLPIQYPTSTALKHMNGRQLKKQHIGPYQIQYFIFQYTFNDDVTEDAKDEFNEALLTRYDEIPFSIILFCSYDGKTVDGMISKGKNRPQENMKLENMASDEIAPIMKWIKAQKVIDTVKSTDLTDYYYGLSGWRAVFESWVESGDYQVIQHNL